MTAELDRFRLDGKVALVTGGTRGLGREMAFAFARNGADVIVSSRKQEACDAVADEIRQETGQQVLGLACHVGKWDSIEPLVDSAYAQFGRVDVLVNNAGMSPLYTSLPEITEDLYDKVFAVNLKGPFRLTALIGARMADGDGGSIINVSSGGAVHPHPNILPYAAAKAGLNTMTASFAHAYGPKVRVNAIMPGNIATDVSRFWDQDALAEKVQKYALQRVGQPSEIVGAALFFASSASSYTTGSIVTVDGGLPL